MSGAAPSLALIVLRVADLEASRRFYAALGLPLVRDPDGRWIALQEIEPT